MFHFVGSMLYKKNLLSHHTIVNIGNIIHISWYTSVHKWWGTLLSLYALCWSWPMFDISYVMTDSWCLSGSPFWFNRISVNEIVLANPSKCVLHADGLLWTSQLGPALIAQGKVASPALVSCFRFLALSYFFCKGTALPKTVKTFQGLVCFLLT